VDLPFLGSRAQLGFSWLRRTFGSEGESVLVSIGKSVDPFELSSLQWAWHFYMLVPQFNRLEHKTPDISKAIVFCLTHYHYQQQQQPILSRLNLVETTQAQWLRNQVQLTPPPQSTKNLLDCQISEQSVS
jgi:hypothetical protein